MLVLTRTSRASYNFARGLASSSHRAPRAARRARAPSPEVLAARKAATARAPKREARVDELELTFLGTASARPSATRNQQALTLRLAGLGETWLFDCGEATQHRMMSVGMSPTDVTRIFVSHMHGDHVFGLPGMICNIAANLADADEPGETAVAAAREKRPTLQIIGPQGLRAFLRATLCGAYATLGSMRFEVVELHGLQALKRPKLQPRDDGGGAHPNEAPSRTLLPDADGVWHVPDAGADASEEGVVAATDAPPRTPLAVRAVELSHTVPTVGWTLVEAPRAGALHAETVKPLLAKHELPFALLRSFKQGQPIELPDGTTLRPEDHMDPPTQRKLVILSDMSGFPHGKDARPAAVDTLAGADVLVHESTNAYVPQVFPEPGKSYRDVERSARSHGHSTPQMAGRLASDLDARALILTHFSTRYPGDGKPWSRKVMEAVASGAHRAFGGEVIAAHDLLSVTVEIDGTLTKANAPSYDDPNLTPEAQRVRAARPPANEEEAAFEAWREERAREVGR